jgi:hypothetical protein
VVEVPIWTGSARAEELSIKQPAYEKPEGRDAAVLTVEDEAIVELLTAVESVVAELVSVDELDELLSDEEEALVLRIDELDSELLLLLVTEEDPVLEVVAVVSVLLLDVTDGVDWEVADERLSVEVDVLVVWLWVTLVWLDWVVDDKIEDSDEDDVVIDDDSEDWDELVVVEDESEESDDVGRLCWLELKPELDAVVVSVLAEDTDEELVPVEDVRPLVEEESEEERLLVEETTVLSEDDDEAANRFAPEM